MDTTKTPAQRGITDYKWAPSEKYPGEWVMYAEGNDPDIWVFCHDGVWHMEAIYSAPKDFNQELPGVTSLEEAQAVALMLVKMR